jgi:hypothetical protein
MVVYVTIRREISRRGTRRGGKRMQGRGVGKCQGWERRMGRDRYCGWVSDVDVRALVRIGKVSREWGH